MSDVPNIYAFRGRHLLSAYHERNKHIPNHKLSDMLPILHNPAPTPELPVCIISAGAAGLYTAMIFEFLGISYQIVDAGDKERVGGRIFTYHFPKSGPYDYYDVGPMRFPNTPFMKRVFDLANNPKRNLSLKLIPYIMQMVEPTANTFLYYNAERINNQAPVVGDPFHVSTYVQDQNLTTPQGVAQKVEQVIQPYRDLFRALPGQQPPEIGTAMTQLFAATNTFSMRSRMFDLQMDPRDINWCETLDKSTGWYDRALTETVIESLAFDWPTAPLPGPEPPNPDPNKSWFCFDRGSSKLPQAMFGSLSASAQEKAMFQSPVTSISVGSNNCMIVSINNEGAQQYSAVISTVPLPRLSLMDLTGVGIAGAGQEANYAQWSAIRELQYGPAVKVGIKFSTPWWETKFSISGGQSFTDLPLRTIVYPSYPEDGTPSKVLIVSYCWTQDAERLGALIHGDGTADQQLIDLIFRDLAAVHGVTVEWLTTFYTEGDYFAWDWLHDPLTMGGYAFFGPGAYAPNDIYCEMLLSAAQGKLFFAGEATGSCHAWVSGALDSAWRAVDQYLRVNNKELLPKFHDEWGPCEYWDEANNQELVELNHKLTERHLVIALHKSGIRL